MDIDVIGANPEAAQTPASDPTTQGASIIDFTAERQHRRRQSEEIPEEVWRDVQRAGELVDDLARSGRQVRFDTHRLTGRIVASLCDSDSRLLRRLTLDEVLDTTRPDPTSAA